MAGNSIGNIFKLTTFGESHGQAIGGVVDGCPAGLKLDIDFIQNELSKRRPGQSEITTQRKEKDELEILSGLFQGTTTGTPIGFIIRNRDQRPQDYTANRDKYRASHADFTYSTKYGIRDFRGGGRSSARETACRVVGGAIAKQILTPSKIQVNAYVSQVGKIKLAKPYNELNLANTYSNPVRCPDTSIAKEMLNYIEEIKEDGDSTGGIITCVISGVPAGLGEPVFDRLEADLAKAMLSINATKGFEIGSGFGGATLKGSIHNDLFTVENEKVVTKTNHSGGIQGGISNGQDVYFNVAFKPTATIMKKQSTVNDKLKKVEMDGKGRHDPCVLPRAVPIVESMAALIITDHLLRNRSSKI